MNNCFARRYVSYIQTSGTRYTFRPDRTLELPLLVASMTCYSSCCFFAVDFFFADAEPHARLAEVVPAARPDQDRPRRLRTTDAGGSPEGSRGDMVRLFALHSRYGDKTFGIRPEYVWSWNKAIGRPVSVLGL